MIELIVDTSCVEDPGRSGPERLLRQHGEHIRDRRGEEARHTRTWRPRQGLQNIHILNGAERSFDH